VRESFIGRLIDDVRGLLRLLTIVSACFAVGTVIFGLSKPAERGGAMAWALFVGAFTGVCAALWASVEWWRRVRAEPRKR